MLLPMQPYEQIDLLSLKSELRVQTIDDKQKIYDPIRKRWFVLQPEELVRQLILMYLTAILKYPSSIIGVEKQLVVNKLRKRFDIVVFNSEGRPLILIETKSPSIDLNIDTALQISNYNKVLKAKYLWLSNGRQNSFYEVNQSENSTQKINSIPSYNEVNL